MRNRPRAQTQHIHTNLPPLQRVLALSTGNGSPPDLPIISSVEDWAYLMHTHTPIDFASLANKYTAATGPTILDSSAVGPINPDTIQNYVHGNC
jgi:hypothetical protein